MNTLKTDVVSLIFWLGRRLCDDSDLDKFRPPENSLLYIFSDLLATSWIKTEGKKAILQHQKKIELIGLKIIQSIQEAKKLANKLVIIIILEPSLAEDDWYQDFSKKIRRASHGQFFYEIVYGTNLRHPPGSSYTDIYQPWEVRAAELGMAAIYFNGDCPTNCGHRLSDFVKRILGLDIEGGKFPGYSIVDLQRMAWHINREDYRAFSKDLNAIPKYAIGPDKRPIFTVPPPIAAP